MSAIDALLSLGSFRGALHSLLTIDPSREGELRLTLSKVEPFDDQSNEDADWEQAKRALSVVYEIAVRESVESVLEAIDRAKVESVDPERLARLGRLITPDESVSERIVGSRQRDGFLPVLARVKTITDLRVLDIDGRALLAPVTTVRMQFDETVGGSDAIVFSLTPSQLDALIEELANARERLLSAETIAREATVPFWAKGDA